MSEGPGPSVLLGRFLRVFVAPLLRALYRTRVIGTENVPAGGALLAGNHVSYLDPMLLWCVAPRPVHFMAKSELFHGFQSWGLPRVWAFPVDRGTPDRTAITTATRLLAAGELVGIFPEGSRELEGEAREAHGGAAFIALRAGAPIVPVGFLGTQEAWPRGQRLPKLGRVTIRFGAPVDPSGFPGSRKEQVAAVTAEVMRRIGEELASAKEIRDAR